MATTLRLLFGLCVLSISGGLTASEIMLDEGVAGHNAIVLAQGSEAQVGSTNVTSEQAVPAIAEQDAETEKKARLEADVRVARLKAKMKTRAELAGSAAAMGSEAAKSKAIRDAQDQAEAEVRRAAEAEQVAAAEAARLKSEQEAQAEAEADQVARKAAEEEAARVQAEQVAGAEVARLKVEQEAQAEAEARRVVEADQVARKVAEEEAARVQAEQQARAAVEKSARPTEEETASLAGLQKIMSTEGLHLVLDPTDADVIFRKEPHDDSSFPVAVVEGGKKFPGRIKVRGSFTRNFLKKSLVITLDGNTTWHGQRRISFNAMATDVTQMREYLAHDLMVRLNMAVPEMHYTKLYMNDSYIGQFLFTEWITPKMFERYGLGSDGELYNPDDTLYCGNFQQLDMKRLEECFIKLDKGGQDYARLKKLAQDLIDAPVDNFDKFLDTNFDTDSVINWLIVNTLTGSEDSYNKNFFLYFSNKTGKWTVVPWDYDASFGKVADLGAPYPKMIYNKFFQYLHSVEYGASSPLKEKTFKNANLYIRYLARLKELFMDVPLQPGDYRGWYHPSNFRQMLAGLEENSRESIKKEKYPNLEIADYPYAVDSLRFFNEWRYQYLTKLMLTPTVWDTLLWRPYMSNEPLTPRTLEYYKIRHIEPINLNASAEIGSSGKRIFFVDSLLATPLLAMDVKALNKPTKVLVVVQTQQQLADTPPGIKAGQCVERAWHINLLTPGSVLETGLEFDFLDEGSTRHEVGAEVMQKTNLAAWIKVAGEWQLLDSEINPRSNSFVVGNVLLNSGEHTLVACTKQ